MYVLVGAVLMEELFQYMKTLRSQINGDSPLSVSVRNRVKMF